MKNAGNRQVISEVADSLRPGLADGIPELVLVQAAREREVWPFEVMEALGATLQPGGVFRPGKVALKARTPAPAPSPAPAPAPAEERVQAAWMPAPRRSEPAPAPAPVQAPAPAAAQVQAAAPAAPRAGRQIRGFSGETWTDRLAFLGLAAGPEELVTIEQAQAQGWPASSWTHPAFWAPSKASGAAAIAAGWVAKIRDGVGVVFQKK